MDTPTYNSEGQAVWKPQPGQYWPKGLQYRESYGGIIAALNDITVAAGDIPKSYPQNFAGIIAALEDLEDYLREGDLPSVEAPPPGWEIITNPDGSIDGNWQYPPPDGTLWFDIRQGRLFIAIDGDFVQTNGGDGIAHVGEDPPTNPPVIGQQWLDTDTGLFYVYIGENIWQAVVSDGDVTITTATLPLAIGRTTVSDVYNPTILPDLPSLEAMKVQKDYNTWLMQGLVNLDKAVTEGSVTISETPPTENVVAGTLWYDSTTLEMSIYYVDDDSEQWVPISSGFAEQALAPFQADLTREVKERKAAIENVLSLIGQMDTADDADVQALQELTGQLTARIEALETAPEVDLSPYVEHSSVIAMSARLQNLELAPPPDMSAYAYQTSVDTLQTQVDNLDLLQLSDVTPLIPDISKKVEQSDIDTSVAAITNDFLPRSGGTVDGSFIVNKSDIDVPAFDVSSTWSNSSNLFKLKSYSPEHSTATFGATDQWWQYAWEFAGQEDFAWVHNGNKVFSITEQGPACSTLYIGQFADNTQSGRRMLNTMEVGEQLRLYHQKFEALRIAVSEATDYESLKTGLMTALSN